MSHPFECQTCKKIVHGTNINNLNCCKDARFVQITKICLLVNVKETPNFNVVHKSGNYVLPSPVGVEWATGCNSQRIAGVTTRYPGAVTCKKCLDFYNMKMEELEKEKTKSEVEYTESETPLFFPEKEASEQS